MNASTSPLYWHRITSPLGPLLLTATAQGLSGLFMEGHSPSFRPRPEGKPDAAPFRETAYQLDAYFAGSRREFDLALDLIGTTFQKQVWRELQEIPY